MYKLEGFHHKVGTATAAKENSKLIEERHRD